MKYVVGIDEVGRGPLAGPVTICVVVCGSENYKKLKRNKDLPPHGKDSKKLKVSDREKYSKVLKSLPEISYSVQHVSNTIIDIKGISFSIKSAIQKGIKELKLKPSSCSVLLDGGLRAPLEFKNQKTIIKGDENERVIAWASILAKVSRDALMCRLAKKYSHYGFEIHKGYGTKNHRKLIQIHGPSPVHRKTFCTRLTT